MVNGTTWEEQTIARLRYARERQKQAGVVRRQSEKDEKYWQEYADSLEKVMELERQQGVVKANGYPILDPEHLRRQSVRENLIEVSKANNGLLVVNEAVTILVDADVFVDRESARNSIYANLYHNRRFFKKKRPGIYQLSTIPNKL